MKEQRITFFLDEWEKVKDELHGRFSKREQNDVPELMKKGIALFYEMIFWCNKGSVEFSREELEQLDLKPINAVERLSFITSRPSNYHSYVQLTELFIELEKIFSKEQIMKKASKP
ncbi:YpoC family protein [Bacillus benzoevorans]